ncbi:MAG: Asp-tRNA(Asn)/Glu-tRNA(Gln) amidotransferase subunit GatA [Lagierella massiliensis]|nr:Asp-tRNA(Asn)/Glu-tRNA(Gln) amidotransferase subunit GatA [Lagierella massiliensis]
MSIKQLRDKFLSNELNIKDYYEKLIKRIEDSKDLNIFITFDKEDILRQIEKIENEEKKGKLYGIPVTLKDNISYKNLKMTCGSKILKDFIPVFDSTVTKRLIEEGAVILGKVNMDEFAMGSSSETSFFGVTKNPLDTKLIPGGSSSGSAAAVAHDIGLFSLGSDTGGSVRQPAQYCNVIGYLPSYGTISRSGVVSMANTLDQVGILTKEVEDIIEVINVIGGNDKKDMTSTLKKELNFKINENYSLSDKKIGIIELKPFDIDPIVEKDYKEGLKKLEELGAKLVNLDFKYLKYSTSLYSVINSCEASSNMSRFDGIRYGYITEDYKDTKELYTKTRSEGFGEEVQRRIALGTMFLASDSNQETYIQAEKVRRLMSEEFENKFKEVDFIVTPTATNLPYEIGTRTDDPLAMYDSGTFNVPANLCGLCSISIPVRDGISGSLQFIAKRFDDENMLNAAYKLERSIRNEL